MKLAIIKNLVVKSIVLGLGVIVTLGLSIYFASAGNLILAFLSMISLASILVLSNITELLIGDWALMILYYNKVKGIDMPLKDAVAQSMTKSLGSVIPRIGMDMQMTFESVRTNGLWVKDTADGRILYFFSGLLRRIEEFRVISGGTADKSHLEENIRLIKENLDAFIGMQSKGTGLLVIPLVWAFSCMFLSMILFGVLRFNILYVIPLFFALPFFMRAYMLYKNDAYYYETMETLSSIFEGKGAVGKYSKLPNNIFPLLYILSVVPLFFAGGIVAGTVDLTSGIFIMSLIVIGLPIAATIYIPRSYDSIHQALTQK
jgi:hypothetical protein